MLQQNVAINKKLIKKQGWFFWFAIWFEIEKKKAWEKNSGDHPNQIKSNGK